jgi:hypothetical protein
MHHHSFKAIWKWIQIEHKISMAVEVNFSVHKQPSNIKNVIKIASKLMPLHVLILEFVSEI